MKATQKMKPLNKQLKKQSGFTLIEMLAVILIMGVLTVTAFEYQKLDMEKKRINVAAGHLQTISKAANAYIRDNYSAIMGIATDVQPVIIRVSDLVSQNYLQPGISATNAYQQATCALVLQPSPGQLTGLVVTQGGQALDDASLSTMVSRIGASAGGIYTDTPAAIIGARGGWAIAHANYGNHTHLSEDCAGNAQPVTMEAGHAHVALWFENNDLTAGFLYREEIPGRPELNRMAANLDMAGNDLTGASKVEATDSFDMNGTSVIDSSRNLVNIDSIFASGNVEVTGKLEANTIKPTLVVSAGSACSENSAIATDASGQILSCQAGGWKTQGPTFKTVLMGTATYGFTVPYETAVDRVVAAGYGAYGEHYKIKQVYVKDGCGTTQINRTGLNIHTNTIRLRGASGWTDGAHRSYGVKVMKRDGSLLVPGALYHGRHDIGSGLVSDNHNYLRGSRHRGCGGAEVYVVAEVYQEHIKVEPPKF